MGIIRTILTPRDIGLPFGESKKALLTSILVRWTFPFGGPRGSEEALNLICIRSIQNIDGSLPGNLKIKSDQ